MIYLSNEYIFPALQLILFVVLLWAFYKDKKGSDLTVVTRVSMLWLERLSGVVAAGIVTAVNKSVFDTTKIFADYSAAINAFDYFAVAYLCFYSSWGRYKLTGFKPKETETH